MNWSLCVRCKLYDDVRHTMYVVRCILYDCSVRSTVYDIRCPPYLAIWCMANRVIRILYDIHRRHWVYGTEFVRNRCTINWEIHTAHYEHYIPYLSCFYNVQCTLYTDVYWYILYYIVIQLMYIIYNVSHTIFYISCMINRNHFTLYTFYIYICTYFTLYSVYCTLYTV